MVSVITSMWNISSKMFTLLTPDFFQLFYTGFILFSLYSATWLLSVKMGDATLANFLWGLSFSLQSAIYFYKSLEYSIFSFFTEKFSWEKLTFSILIFAHGIRLSSYLILREVGKGEDRRYSKLREKLGNHFWWMSYFLIFMPAMAINMLIGSQIYAFANVDKSKIGHLSYWGGISLMLAGGLLGALADIQKYTFKTNKRNEGKILDRGLWGLTRHPNYLGEVIYWWGVYLVNFSAGILWTFFCPILLTFMILFATGIPVNERIMKEDHGDEYVEYAKRVPIFLPFIGAKGTLKDTAGKMASSAGFTGKGSKTGDENRGFEDNRQKIKQ